MFRVLQDINAKNVDATKTADVAMVKGMGVQKSGTEAILPAAATCADIFFVTKEFIPTGVKASMGEVSDYDTDFENIKANERVVLVKPIVGEIYWTDQTDTVAVGDYLVVGADGKFEKATTGETSNLIVRSITDKDAGTHAGTTIEVVDFKTIA